MQPLDPRPAPFSAFTTPDLWDDPHISARMLALHLDPDAEPASRPHAFVDRSVSWVVDVLDLAPGDRVLDLGCGPGLYACRLARRGIRVHGVDVSRRSVAHARSVAEAEGLDVPVPSPPPTSWTASGPRARTRAPTTAGPTRSCASCWTGTRSAPAPGSGSSGTGCTAWSPPRSRRSWPPPGSAPRAVRRRRRCPVRPRVVDVRGGQPPTGEPGGRWASTDRASAGTSSMTRTAPAASSSPGPA